MKLEIYGKEYVFDSGKCYRIKKPDGSFGFIRLGNLKKGQEKEFFVDCERKSLTCYLKNAFIFPRIIASKICHLLKI